MLLNAADELININALQALNAAYQDRPKLGVSYPSFFWYNQPYNATIGFASSYSPLEKTERTFRKLNQKFFRGLSFRNSLFRKLEIENFQDGNGAFL